MSRCLNTSCGRRRATGQAFCYGCWHSIPPAMRAAFNRTRPHSDERRGALLELVRYFRGDS